MATAETLTAALRDLSSRCLGSSNASLAAFNALTEAHLSSLDQTTALVDAARLDMQRITDVAFSGLLEQTRVRFFPPHTRSNTAPPPHALPPSLPPSLLQEVSALFSVIDAVEAATVRAQAATRAAAERLEVLQAAAGEGGTGGGGAPAGLARVAGGMAALFGRGGGGGGGGGAGRAADAPVKLPPFEPPSIDVVGELKLLREAVGSAEELAAARAARGSGGSGSSGGGGGEGGDKEGEGEGAGNVEESAGGEEEGAGGEEVGVAES
jgi:hypothetical protein